MTSTGRDDLKPLLARAADLLARRDYRGCHALCLEAVQRDPGAAEPYFLLGVIAAEHGVAGKAADLFDRAIAQAEARETGGAPARYHAQRARALSAGNRHDEAQDAIAAAIAGRPTDAYTLDTIGVVLSKLGRHGEATGFLRQAADTAPGNPEHFYNLAASAQFAGDFETARGAYERAIALDPRHHRAHAGLAGLDRQTPDKNRIAAMTALFETAPSVEARLHLGHAIAKSLEDLGDYAGALDWLQRGKAGLRARIERPPDADAPLFAAAARLAALPVAAEPAAAAHAPVFVVGLPRTGTTLVDRILSSHSAVASVGELTSFALYLKQAARTPSPRVLDAETLDAARSVDLSGVGARYLASAAKLHDGAAFFVDKMPHNFFYAPALLAAIPSARVLCLKRGAMDSCLSNYRQIFAAAPSYYDYALDLLDAADYVAAFEDLTATWRKTLPPARYAEIAYEDIVADQERATRRMLDFCGLAFEEACLDFHRNAAPVATASSVQVRQPLYASSVDRWRRYGPALDAVRERLESRGVAV